MITIDRSHRHGLTTTKVRQRASRKDHPSAPRLRPQLLADAVIAGYIHDISARHRSSVPRNGRYQLAADGEAA